jgi:hypothetical protein
MLLNMNIWKLYLQHYVRGSCNVLTIYFLRSMILVMYKLNKNHNKYYETKGVVKCKYLNQSTPSILPILSEICQKLDVSRDLNFYKV